MAFQVWKYLEDEKRWIPWTGLFPDFSSAQDEKQRLMRAGTQFEIRTVNN